MSELREFVNNLERRLAGQAPKHDSLEPALKGEAIELWSDLLGERLWLVADEADARRLAEPRGTIYTASEARMICRITDKNIVRQVHAWKRKFNGRIREQGSARPARGKNGGW